MASDSIEFLTPHSSFSVDALCVKTKRLGNAHGQRRRVAPEHRDERQLELLTGTPNSKANGVTDGKIREPPAAFASGDRNVVNRQNDITHADLSRGSHCCIDRSHAWLDREVVRVSAALVATADTARPPDALQPCDADGAGHRSVLWTSTLRARFPDRESREHDTREAANCSRIHGAPSTDERATRSRIARVSSSNSDASASAASGATASAAAPYSVDRATSRP